MEKRHRKVRKTVRRSTSFLVALRWCLAVVVVLVMTWGLWAWRGERTVRGWRNGRRMASAERLFQAGKPDEAAAVARSVFDADNNNVAAVRLIAAAAERISPFAARPWRQRAFDLEPWNLTNRIDLAIINLRAGDATTARNLLAAVGTNAPASPAYFEALGAASFAVGDLVGSERSFAQSTRLDPANIDRQFNLAKVQLAMDSAARNAEARKTLDRLATNPATRIAALTLRVEDAIRGNRTTEAVRISEQLIGTGSTNIPFNSRLLYLSALRAAKSPKLNTALSEVQKISLDSPLTFAQLAVWMSSNGMSAAAWSWVRTIPRERLSDPSARIAVADLFIGIQDWLGLRQWVRAEDWKAFNSFRLAYDALAAQHLAPAESRTTEIETIWQRAIKAAERNPAQLQALAKLAGQWRITPQFESTLWAISESGVAEEAALMDLHRLYSQKEDTLGQLKVARRLLALRPNDLSALNNVIYLGLLLDPKDSKLLQMADTLHEKSPKNPNHVATYAFAQFRRGQVSKAIETMNTLPADVLKKPALAAFQGVYFAHANNARSAREFLTLAAGATLLPEEDALVRTAKAMVRMTP